MISMPWMPSRLATAVRSSGETANAPIAMISSASAAIANRRGRSRAGHDQPGRDGADSAAIRARIVAARSGVGG